MSQVDNDKKINIEQIIQITTLIGFIITLLKFGYAAVEKLYFSQESINVSFDNVYLDEKITLKQSDSFFIPDKGLTKATLIPLNCKVIITNKSTKAVNIVDINTVRSGVGKNEFEILAVDDRKSDRFLNYIYVDGKKINNSSGNLTEPIFISPKSSKILTFNINHALPKEVIDILNSKKDSFVNIHGKYPFSGDFNFYSDEVTLTPKIFDLALQGEGYSIFGKKDVEEIIIKNTKAYSLTIPEQQLPYLNMSFTTANNKKFYKDGRFNSFDGYYY